VEQLVADKLVKKVVINKDTVMYEAMEAHAHDHFICNDCGTVESVDASKISLKGRAVATDVIIRGTCNNCI
jgi:Fe2+ or Zn2+ uptake regulation protein